MAKVVGGLRLVVRQPKAKRGVALSKIDNDLAYSAEVSGRVSQNKARLGEKLRARSSGKTWKASLRDEVADRDKALEIQHALSVGATVRLTGKAGPGVINRRNTIHEEQREEIEDQYQKDRRRHLPDLSRWIVTMKVPLWDHTGDGLKSFAWAIAISQTQARAITLHLGPEVIKAGLKHDKGIAQYVRDQIQRRLKSEFAKLGEPTPEFFIIVEATELGPLHIHGAITEPGNPKSLKAIKRALKAAGGKWVGPSGKVSGRQLSLAKLETSVRWMGYVTKWRLQSAKRLNGPVMACSNGLRTRAKHWYTAARVHGLLIKPGATYQDYGDLLAAFERENTAGPLI
jgi:hypothetical protein